MPHHIIVYTEKCGPVAVPAGPSIQSFCTTDVTVDISSNDSSGDITVYRMEASPPNDPGATLQRHWILSGLEGSTFSANLIFAYSDADITAAGIDEEKLVLIKSLDGQNYQALSADTDTVGNTVETVDEQTSFSIWGVKEFVCGDFGYPTGDLEENCIVDFRDIAIMGMQWLQPPGDPSADIAPDERDNMVDWLDLRALCQHWLEDTKTGY